MATIVVHPGEPGKCYLCGNDAVYDDYDAWPDEGRTYVIAYRCRACDITWREYYNYLGYRKDND